MTTVRPLSSADIVQMMQSVEDLKDVSGVKDKDTSDRKNPDDDDLIFADEKFADNDALAKCLSPLATILTIFGFYFKHEEAVVNGGTSRGFKANKQRAYCIAVLILLWLNASRCTMVFTGDDKFGSQLLIKLVWMAVVLLCAILDSSYFIASESGALDRLVREIRVSHANVLYFRKFFLFVVPGRPDNTPNAITQLPTVVLQVESCDLLGE
jgi:hypothetical protein